MIATLLAKLTEPSTISGLLSLAALVGFAVPLDLAPYISGLIIAASGAYDVWRRERA